MNRQEIILKRHMLAMKNTIGVSLPVGSDSFVLRAMEEFGNETLSIYKKESSKAKLRLVFALFGVLGKHTWDDFMMNRRIKNLSRLKKIYQKLSNEDRRKYYIIRSGDTEYKVLSTADVQYNKRIRVFGKHVDAITLTATADYTVYPKNK